jgi:hypothetical protein
VGGACVPAVVEEALDYAEQAQAELRELAHGILPSVRVQVRDDGVGGARATAMASWGSRIGSPC